MLSGNPNPFRSLGLAGWAVVALVAVAIIAAGIWWAGGGARREAAQAKAAAAMSDARAKSGREATDTVATGAARDAAGDKLTQENRDAIDRATGSDQPVHPDAHRAGLVSLCKRAAYRGRPECVQLLGAVELPDAHPRR